MTSAILILGSHRSGTSLTGNIIHKMGVFIANDLGVDRFNKRGYWEDLEITNLNEQLLTTLGGSWSNPPSLPAGWEEDYRLARFKEEARHLVEKYEAHPVWGWKDPRFSLTLPFWKQFLPANVLYLICVRDPLSVAKSLEERDLFEIRDGCNLWYTYMLNSISNVSGSRARLVYYNELVENTEITTGELAEFLNLAAMATTNVVATKLRHHRASQEELLTSTHVPAAAKLLYALLAEANSSISIESITMLARGCLLSELEGSHATESADAKAMLKRLRGLEGSGIVRLARRLRLVRY